MKSRRLIACALRPRIISYHIVVEMPALRRSPQPFISVVAGSAFAPLVRSAPYPPACMNVRSARCRGRPGRNGGGTIDRSPSGCRSSACRFPCRHMATRAADSMIQKFGRRFRAARRNVLPFRHCSEPFRLPKSAKCDVDHIRRGVLLICPPQEMHPSAKESVMTWSSDRASVLLYAILATLLVMAWICVPA